MKHQTSLPRLVSSTLARLFVLASAFLVILAAASPAHAAGRVEWKSKTVKERTSNKSWYLEIKIFLPKAPDMAHMPMKFEFEPIAYYDRSMVDGDKLVEQRLPLEHRQPLIESVDVGFMDPGSGQIQARTKFSFKVTRAHGYEAGEYKVTIRDSRSGQTIGTPTTLKFEGENEIIDRRSIIFTGKKKKKEEPADSEKSEPEKTEESTGSDDGIADSADDEPYDVEGADDDGGAPPSIEEKPGACGCHHGPSHDQPLLWLAMGAVLVGFVMRRRELHAQR